MRNKKNLSIILSLFLFIFVVFILEISLRTFYAGLLYYRPHEILIYYDAGCDALRYKKNKTITMTMPYGDLVAVDKRYNIPGIVEPREIRFTVDSYGFRNVEDYRGQDYVLVGDSFIAGNGNSQDDTLDEQLRRDYNLDMYNLGIEGDMHSYANNIMEFQKDHGDDFKALLFVFEGNDFISSPNRRINSKKMISDLSARINYNVRRLCRKLYICRLLYWRFKILVRGLRNDNENIVLLKIKDKDIKLLEPDQYIQATHNRKGDVTEDLLEILEPIRKRIAYIYFIPTRYRVYYDFIEKEDHTSLSNSNWQCLQDVANRLNIPCANLTDYLVEESSRLLGDNKLTWWRDDSHWNKCGIAVAAKVIANTYK